MPLTVTKPLKRKWNVGNIVATDVEFREALVEDLVAAEQIANPNLSPNAFRRALAAETIVRAGTFTGPFTPGHFSKLGGANWTTMNEAMSEAGELGED